MKKIKEHFYSMPNAPLERYNNNTSKGEDNFDGIEKLQLLKPNTTIYH